MRISDMRLKIGVGVIFTVLMLVSGLKRSAAQINRELGVDISQCIAKAQLELKLVYRCDNVEGIWNLSVPLVFSYNSGLLRIVRDNPVKLKELTQEGHLIKLVGISGERERQQDTLRWFPIEYRSFIMKDTGVGGSRGHKEISVSDTSWQHMEVTLTLQDDIEQDENNLRFNVEFKDLERDSLDTDGSNCKTGLVSEEQIPFDSSKERERVKLSVLSGSNPSWKAIPIQVDDRVLVDYLLKPRGKIDVKLAGEINLTDGSHKYRKSWSGTFTFTAAYWHPDTGKSGPIQ